MTTLGLCHSLHVSKVCGFGKCHDMVVPKKEKGEREKKGEILKVQLMNVMMWWFQKTNQKHNIS